MIHTFKGSTRWLSNFATVNVTYKDKVFPSVEHAYMSAKIDSEEWREFCTSPERTGGQIKRISQHALLLQPLVEDWEEIKVNVMAECLWSKFQQEPFRTMLLETGDQNLQEGNEWNDKFWGVDLKESPNVGENHLGRLIMNVRDKLKQEENGIL